MNERFYLYLIRFYKNSFINRIFFAKFAFSKTDNMQIKIFVFNPVQENTYLLYDEKKNAVIIDCGSFGANEQQALADFIESNQLKLTRLLNTHLHFDHVLGNHFLFEKYGIKPEYNEIEEMMPGLKEASGTLLSPLKYTPVMADHFIQDGDEIVAGDIRLKAIHTPGHSPGSLSFYSESANCIFTGDALFQESIGRTDLWGGNYEQLINAIKTRILTLPEDTLVYPGHGPKTTVGYEKQNNPFL